MQLKMIERWKKLCYKGGLHNKIKITLDQNTKLPSRVRSQAFNLIMESAKPKTDSNLDLWLLHNS
jgi:hypothetical protein